MPELILTDDCFRLFAGSGGDGAAILFCATAPGLTVPQWGLDTRSIWPDGPRIFLLPTEETPLDDNALARLGSALSGITTRQVVALGTGSGAPVALHLWQSGLASAALAVDPASLPAAPYPERGGFALYTEPGSAPAAAHGGITALPLRLQPTRAREALGTASPARDALLAALADGDREAVRRAVRALYRARPEPYQRLFAGLVQRGKPTRAIGLSALAEQAVPDDVSILVLRSKALALAGEPEAALERSGAALERAPRIPGPLLQHVSLLVQSGRGQEAAALIAASPARHPDLFRHHVTLLRASGQDSEAASVLQQALAAFPDHSPLRALIDSDNEAVTGNPDAPELPTEIAGSDNTTAVTPRPKVELPRKRGFFARLFGN